MEILRRGRDLHTSFEEDWTVTGLLEEKEVFIPVLLAGVLEAIFAHAVGLLEEEERILVLTAVDLLGQFCTEVLLAAALLEGDLAAAAVLEEEEVFARVPVAVARTSHECCLQLMYWKRI